jgi:hypothetical protein
LRREKDNYEFICCQSMAHGESGEHIQVRGGLSSIDMKMEARV